MDIDDYNELKQRFSSLSTAELTKIVSAKPGEYRDEALAAARDLIATRPDVQRDSGPPPSDDLPAASASRIPLNFSQESANSCIKHGFSLKL